MTLIDNVSLRKAFGAAEIEQMPITNDKVRSGRSTTVRTKVVIVKSAILELVLMGQGW